MRRTDENILMAYTAMGATMEGKREYETLNGIRGAAAISVVIFHTFANFWPRQAMSGHLAVDIFFVLSGFVLAASNGAKLETGALTTGEFVLRRLVRFYPLYLLGLALGTVQMIGQSLTGSPNAIAMWRIPAGVLSALLFLPSIGTGVATFSPLNYPAWSLVYEFWINVAWAAVARFFKPWTYVLVALLAGTAFGYFVLTLGGANLGPRWESLPAGVARTIFSFTLGIILYRIRSRAAPVRTIWSVAALIAVFAMLFYDPAVAFRPFYDLLIVIAASPLLIFFGSRVEPTSSLLPVFKWLGAMSFPIYAIHAPLIAMCIFIIRKTHIDPPVVGAVFVIALFACGWCAHGIDLKIQAMFKARRHRLQFQAA